ncbi:HNH endonuclease [Desulfonema magnum]|uniref:HNH nuclease domain-containing protein n=1 Tax=Desulfonema magnum TaxID=45655 RepID=A0A975BXY7_9BACT|nr:HNH endonuclease signature motif containing protein [Desulfonema magnum]QTA93412.1 HNH nuclease domain-containing protein [Desulfonema magnum]
MNKIKRKSWTREELILAINLYCKTPFGKIHIRNPEIIDLAKKMGRSAGSVSYKLANFASLDPSLKRKGASHTNKLDREVWNEFFENWEGMALESELSMAVSKGEKSEFEFNKVAEGKTRDVVVKSRINQNFFRQMILASYNNTCCITGMFVPDLLIASHIVPWSVDEDNRLNPSNGLCLNALHDRAFDK